MKIAVAGTGYVGLVTGTCLAEMGQTVVCFDVQKEKIVALQQGRSPIYEQGLEPLIQKNMNAGRLSFTADEKEAYGEADIVFLAVGTPEKEDGSADLTYMEAAVFSIARTMTKDIVLVTKSTVPVGTNERIRALMERWKPPFLRTSVISNPEFLREGSAVHDWFYGDRIVIGASEADKEAAELLSRLYEPLGIPIVRTDLASAEMIKYASNAFLATKISFINEIANICEKVGATIDDVAYGIGLDKRIGSHFLQAGIGYGGSCFPKDTKALVQIAGNVQHKFELLEAVIQVNNRQQALLVEKAKQHMSLRGKNVALLGLAFKPNTDDVREAASLVIANRLLAEGAHVVAYDPIATDNAKNHLPSTIRYASSVTEAIRGADAAFIVTEWDVIKQTPLSVFREKMRTPIIFDGRNCYSLDEAKQANVTYVSIGRAEVVAEGCEVKKGKY
ncbi:UDPglucose 6-dehydrogenase [Anoxybacillus voinovskiensis]|uniref:UDP-glucose 6-dehydrogenase n=1 Tax=Anoxybacteroides voinovskiense TaxID=230470 RepID=A0A840DYM5_9BACL|nr:UDP-glucose/GDP-mannose dehydrogenase family protein [Anoxybacillus voinovskiensis]MBB4075078.1 UDPglucose 6-dehydrogenase [Anoxybacillus voinovskiensis]GGJ76656.1 UDP-glucose 6-dehydrogenase YwqF [Anoxybacillus voinovskiensis]